MVYIRHRDRMVQQSVIADLQDTLIACRWMVGTTSREVTDPDTGLGDVITVAEADVFPLADGYPVTLLDYFPETLGEAGGTTAPNTLAVDTVHPGDPEFMEMGSALLEQPYRVALALQASSEAAAKAIMSDLKDRYEGRIVSGAYVQLIDYVTDPDTVVLDMEVDSFMYARDTSEATPSEVFLFYAELSLVDFVDGPDGDLSS